MFVCSAMDGIALNSGRITDTIPLIEEVNFFLLQFIYSGNIRKLTIPKFLNLLPFKMTIYVVGMVAQENVIYFCKVYVMDRVQTADKAEYLCLG